MKLNEQLNGNFAIVYDENGAEQFQVRNEYDNAKKLVDYMTDEGKGFPLFIMDLKTNETPYINDFISEEEMHDRISGFINQFKPDQ